MVGDIGRLVGYSLQFYCPTVSDLQLPELAGGDFAPHLHLYLLQGFLSKNHRHIQNWVGPPL